MKTVFFYFGYCLQILGICLVGFCLLYGLQSGDYGRPQLYQFLGGAFIFYIGHFLRL